MGIEQQVYRKSFERNRFKYIEIKEQGSCFDEILVLVIIATDLRSNNRLSVPIKELPLYIAQVMRRDPP